MGIWQSLWKFIDEFMRDVTAFGGFFFTGLVVLATFALGYYLLSFKLILGFVILIALVVLIRMVYFRERPNRVSHTNTSHGRIDHAVPRTNTINTTRAL